MTYLLDTNAVIALLKFNDKFRSNMMRHSPQDIAISAIVAHELYFGAYKSERREKNLADIEILQFQILEFSQEDARSAGALRAHLSREGTPIGPYDVLIAGQARARSLVLVTRNVREFERIGGLTIENWEG
ncbi:type II toxin-antitoxin system VapC family toxin [Phyllobacterium pellucidum]|uniref:type II toxin-antitoxin system VapC family toxin n=1 Tax=Phyllobacterium pellucidum TaxID=2740464 RepID=UPI001D1382F4|nr:type II toxin-antitoxin system VapC family toxin [Phyllobacterium sp. T1018]UGY10619.1 type II toxin-antitoxin system VapC family toxin [Phyllobacterium sp. T1018]